MLSKLNKRRAVSPVIATVIIVAVTITVAVAVSYWMSGIAGQYTAFEKVEIKSTRCVLDPGAGDYWIITIDMKNSGSKASTLTELFINEVEVTGYGQTTPTVNNTVTTDMTTEDDGVTNTPFQITSGDTKTVIIWIGIDYGTLSSGTTINVKIHSAGGMDYIKLLPLT